MSLGSPYGQPFDDDLSAAVDNATAHRCSDASPRLATRGQALCDRHACCRPTALSVAQTTHAEPLSCPSCRLLLRRSIAGNFPGRLPALVRALSRQTDPGSRSVWERRRGQSARVHCVCCGVVGRQDRPRGPRRLRLQPEDLEHRRGRRADRHHRPGRSGRSVRGRPSVQGTPNIPGYMISQANSARLQERTAEHDREVRSEFRDSAGVRSIVGSSSRGPQHEDTTLIKPEIGAPGRIGFRGGRLGRPACSPSAARPGRLHRWWRVPRRCFSRRMVEARSRPTARLRGMRSVTGCRRWKSRRC